MEALRFARHCLVHDHLIEHPSESFWLRGDCTYFSEARGVTSVADRGVWHRPNADPLGVESCDALAAARASIAAREAPRPGVVGPGLEILSLVASFGDSACVGGRLRLGFGFVGEGLARATRVLKSGLIAPRSGPPLAYTPV
jgi:hypothetical protein